MSEGHSTGVNPLILIGGNGFLGSAYASHLSCGGREVVILGRDDWRSGRAAHIEAAMIGRQPQIVDFAYATVPSSSFADPVADFTSNLGSMIRHLEFARRVGAGRHLFISSGGTVYGDQNKYPIAEDAPPQPISPYGITKLASEHYAAMYRRLGVPTMVVRPSNIYGPGQLPFRGQGLVATAFGAALRGEPLTLYGGGLQRRDYLYVNDFCTALDAVLDRGKIGQAYNLGCGTATRAIDLVTAIGALTARKGYPLKLLSGEHRTFDVGCNLLDITKICETLDWGPRVALDEGLELTWRWISR